jgi:ribosome-associated toxin RatA of RatAB toxin-antitoxin module
MDCIGGAYSCDSGWGVWFLLMRRHNVWINSILLFAVSASSPLAADGEDWRPQADGWEYLRSAEGIKLYRRPAEGSGIPAFLARVRINASARRVFDVISDYNHFADFVPSVAQSRVLETAGRTSRVYQRLEFPIPVADRHYIIRTENRLENERGVIVRIDWQLDEQQSRVLEKDVAVLPEAFSGFWHLTEDVSGSACDAIYSIHVKPGGKLPAWLFNRAAGHYVLDIVTAVRERVSSN